MCCGSVWQPGHAPLAMECGLQLKDQRQQVNASFQLILFWKQMCTPPLHTSHSLQAGTPWCAPR